MSPARSAPQQISVAGLKARDWTDKPRHDLLYASASLS
jgi:hypothetical protein